MTDLTCSTFSLTPKILMLAFILDLIIGDPRWLPHPVRMIGSAAEKTESILRKYFRARDKACLERQGKEKIGGVILVTSIVASVFLTTLVILEIASMFSHPLFILIYGIVVVYLASTTIAIRELIHSTRLVIDSLKQNSLEEARQRLSMIVGRDTRNLSRKEILRATIETLSENLSDGIIAPVFYLTIGGLPIAMAYKAINTLDSMIGYKNERYIRFGWMAARLDDIANYVPARITGILIVISTFVVMNFIKLKDGLLGKKSNFEQYSTKFDFVNALRIMKRDGRKHTSPNAGIPEAAMAGSLGVRLGGQSTYRGILIWKPFIGEEKQNSEGFYLDAYGKAIVVSKIAIFLGITISLFILSIKTSL